LHYRSRLSIFQVLVYAESMYRFNKAEVFKGRATQFPVCLVDASANQLPTSGITAAFLRIENEDGSFIEKQSTAGIVWGISPEQTFLQIFPFTKEETALFKSGLDMKVWLKLVFGENEMKYEIPAYLKVYDEVY
jgi:hypothetical protein